MGNSAGGLSIEYDVATLHGLCWGGIIIPPADGIVALEWNPRASILGRICVSLSSPHSWVSH